jgi:O-antigen/teichoic acid export membrane protein
MSRIRRNIVANTLGRGWSMFLGVALLPLYVRFLGAEAYGLVGLYGTISVICSLFDVGISASLGRELARASVEDEPGKQTAELVRTAEVLYFGIGLLLGGLVAISAPVIVTKWLNVRALAVEDATQAVRLMGLFLVFQWSTGLYLAGLAGLQRQVELNVISSIGTTLRAGGSVIVLWKISPSIVAFYWWQVVATVVYLLASRETLWRAPGISRHQAAFKWSVTRSVRAFAAGVTLLSLVSVIASQLDKIVLTRLVPLESFGYYSFATAVAAAATFFGQPVLAATYPPMIEAFARGDDDRLTNLFHRAAQLVSVAIFAPAAVLCAFAPVVLRLWARDPVTAARASDLVSACLIGAALNGAAVMPYNLTLAAGRVRPAMLAAGTGALVYGSVLALLAPRMGVMAGAIGGALVNFAGLLVYARFAVSRILPGQAWRWLTADLFLPCAVAALVAALVRAASPPSLSLDGQMAGLLLASFATPICAALVTPAARQELLLRIQRLRSIPKRLI